MSTLAELSFRGKAALLVPLPSAASGHQMKNARLLEAREAALVMEEDSMSVKTLKGVLEHLHNHPEKRHSLALHLKNMKLGDLSEPVTSRLLGLF